MTAVKLMYKIAFGRCDLHSIAKNFVNKLKIFKTKRRAKGVMTGKQKESSASSIASESDLR